MIEMNADVTFNEVMNISICRLQKGYSLTINKETIELINTTILNGALPGGCPPQYIICISAMRAGIRMN